MLRAILAEDATVPPENELSPFDVAIEAVVVEPLMDRDAGRGASEDPPKGPDGR